MKPSDKLRELGFGNQAVIVGTKRKELFNVVDKMFEEERETLITQLMVWTDTQTLSREQLQHKGCGNHNGTNECCRNETLELVRTKLNQLKGNHD